MATMIAEADRDLGGRDHEHEEHDRLAADVVSAENATNVTLTALSMSSTHMNITSTLRRTSRPTAPMVKRIARERAGSRCR